MTALIDIGLNLSSNAFDNLHQEVLERALEAGVQQTILTGTCLQSSERVIQLCQQYAADFPNMLSCTVGIHPHDAKTWDAQTYNTLKDMSQQQPVVAIGETGLDFNRNFSPPDQQQRAFELQCELAAETGLPIFMHERDAHQRQFEILRSYRDQLSDGVIHCFTGDKKALFGYLDLDLHIGITGWVCDERRGEELQQIVGNIPLDRLMIETDAPYLIPRNMRPRPKKNRNEPAYLPWVLKGLAEHRRESIEELTDGIYNTTRRFFRLGKTAI